ASGAGSIWVADRSDNVLTRINPGTNRVRKRIKIGFTSYAVAFGAGSVWVTSEADGTVRRISPKKNRVIKKIRVGTTPNGVVYAFASLGAGDRGRGTLARTEAATTRVPAKPAIPGADWITPSPDALWVSSESGQVVRVDPETATIAARIKVGANPLGS